MNIIVVLSDHEELDDLQSWAEQYVRPTYDKIVTFTLLPAYVFTLIQTGEPVIIISDSILENEMEAWELACAIKEDNNQVWFFLYTETLEEVCIDGIDGVIPKEEYRQSKVPEICLFLLQEWNEKSLRNIGGMIPEIKLFKVPG